MVEALELLLRLNLAAGAAILAVLLLRAPVRRLFGAMIAYGLWGLVPLAVAAMLIPARVVVLPRPSPDIADLPVAGAAASAAPIHLAPPSDLAPWLAGIWIAGVVVALAGLVCSQVRFVRAARQGRAGPAVVGVLRPRIVTPGDFEGAYSPQERRLVLAHEATHIARQDSRINAMAALVRCLNWFNPLIWLMARGLRIDQEFACDAAVIARYPRSRRAYGEALLKAQMAARPLPLGCYWPAPAAHPLVARIALLARPRADAMTRAAGFAILTLVALGGAGAVWAGRPARLEFSPSHEAVILERAVRFAPPLREVATRLPPRALPHPAAAGLAASTSVADDTPTPQPVAFNPTLNVTLASAQPADARLIPAVDIAAPEPEARIRGAADLSLVEPGMAVRVIATMIDRSGTELTTDLTAFGSQSLYRVGYVERNGSRLKLFTSMVQHGDRFRVTAALNRFLQPPMAGGVELAAGESGTIRLPTGEEVTVRVYPRPETAEEVAAARALGGRRFVNVEPFQRTF